MFSIYCIRELFPYILLNSKTRIHPRIPYIAFPVQAWDSGPSIFRGSVLTGLTPTKVTPLLNTT